VLAVVGGRPEFLSTWATPQNCWSILAECQVLQSEQSKDKDSWEKAIIFMTYSWESSVPLHSSVDWNSQRIWTFFKTARIFATNS